MKFMDKLVGKKENSIFPIYNIGKDNDKLYKKFRKYNLEVSYMPYPFKDSDKHLRIILKSNTSKKDLKKLKFIRSI